MVTTSRLMIRSDANLSGNIHGGTILKMIEEAAYVACVKFLSKSTTAKQDEIRGVLLAGIWHVDFDAPMFVGELSHVEASVVYTSLGSTIDIVVNVTAENLRTKSLRKTNTARLSYVHVDCCSLKPVKVPSLNMTTESKEAGETHHTKKKALRLSLEYDLQKMMFSEEVSKSKTTLCEIVSSQDCINGLGILRGGFIMKLMDNAAGIAAYKHCKTNIVTACIDHLNFHVPIYAGNVLHVTSVPIFASSRSLQILVVVMAEDLITRRKFKAVTGIFTFVSLGENRNPLTITQLTPETLDEKTLYQFGKVQYEVQKEKRRKSNGGNNNKKRKSDEKEMEIGRKARRV
eukprot:GSMAST32.ASY1.ANO1.2279.1 assembled CDS